MEGIIDKNKPYGLVLEGGGARGAYQIGAWKALRELGVNIIGVVGTSVGALNGALIAMDSFEEAVDLWEHVTYSQIMDVNDSIIDKLKQMDLKINDYPIILKDIKKLVMDGGVDISPLKKLIAQFLDEEKIRSSAIDFGLVTVSLSELKPLEVFLEQIPQGELLDFLIASSYLPVFKKEKIRGKWYLDGGFHNKAPTNMLIEKGYKDIIIVRIYGPGIERKIKDDETVDIIEIYSDEDLGGLLEFDTHRCKYNIQLGYYDALRVFRGLKGKSYYIKPTQDEYYYMNKIIGLSYELKMKFIDLFNIKKPYNRGMLEEVVQNIGKRIIIGDQWNYDDFVIEVIDFLANKFKIERFNVYTDMELIHILKEKINHYETMMNKDLKETNQLRELLLQMIKEF
ncbi:NTE family protein [Natranaerovirga hydrolytica]|uniref:NTE family protein n=1 Tax=Natranaerovirga hydrolytica TaxID=680378 RepID=A0A4V2PZN9_9FIRM|nr:patatin-like phospholipase family protein [Natranaerovirga hydrolytica]TCK90571.1 NTE family protein [Natranaerovirga hydrolytica]